MANHKKTVYRNLLLPISLNDWLTSNAKGARLNKLYYIIWTIQTHRKRKEMGACFYKKIAQTYWESMLGREYYKFLNFLGENGVIDCDEKFGSDECKGWRISPTWYCGEFSKVKFKYTAKTTTTKQYEAEKRELDNFIEIFRNLEIPFDVLYRAIEEKVNDTSLVDYEVDERVNFPYPTMKVYELYDDWQIVEYSFMSKRDALIIAYDKQKTLINDGYRILIAEPSYFLAQQKEFTRQSWTMAVDNLTEETLYAKRNKTNNRLDSNFTNLAKPLYDIILLHNVMGESDLVNSQPTLLAHLMKQQGIEGRGVQAFIEATESGFFYELFGSDRGKTKKMVFEVLFGKNPANPDLNNPTLARFVELFPDVYNYIRGQKMVNGKASVAIALQKIESQLFIDGIYYDLLQQNIPCFTKHDSISFWQDDREAVARAMDRNFAKMNFTGKIKTEYVINAAA